MHIKSSKTLIHVKQNFAFQITNYTHEFYYDSNMRQDFSGPENAGSQHKPGITLRLLAASLVLFLNYDT